jgi:cytochrome P450
MPIVTELELPSFDYSTPGLAPQEYHRRLAELRKQGWLARSPLAVVVLDREGGEFFLRSRATAFPGREIAELFGVTSGPLREQIDANILNLDGERHRRLRALIGPAFTPRAADRWRPVMREFIAELWTEPRPDPRQAPAPAGAGSCEFVEAVAKPYPARTIAAVLGAPRTAAGDLATWSNWVQRQFDVRTLATDREAVEQAVTELYAYVEELLAARRASPSDDLVSALLAAEADGERLSPSECVNLVLNVLAGGVDTTQSQLAHALRLFAIHPDQWALLARRPELVPQAVQEVLRFEPITPFTARICTEQVEHRGVVFPAGTIVAICAERANRDGPGGPGGAEPAGGEDFDISAERDGRLLTFGAGSHYCLGANLARAELEEALAFLAPRMPGLHLTGPARLGGLEGIYGVEELPLGWSDGRAGWPGDGALQDR